MPGLNKNRKRNMTIAFRVTPEENELVTLLAKTANMTKQNYIMSKLTDTEIVVHPSTLTYKALKEEMVKVYVELSRIRSASDMSEDLVRRVELLADIFRDLGVETPKPQLDVETTYLKEMRRE